MCSVSLFPSHHLSTHFLNWFEAPEHFSFLKREPFILLYTSILHNPAVLLKTDHQNTLCVTENAHPARFFKIDKSPTANTSMQSTVGLAAHVESHLQHGLESHPRKWQMEVDGRRWRQRPLERSDSSWTWKRGVHQLSAIGYSLLFRCQSPHHSLLLIR